MNRTEAPKVLFIAEADRAVYEKIRAGDGPFKDKEWRDIFTFCVAVGFSKASRIPLPKKKTYLLRTESFKDQQLWLVNAVAISAEGKIEILADQEAVWKIAEEYANSGVQILRDRLFSDTHGVFLKELEKELSEIVAAPSP